MNSNLKGPAIIWLKVSSWVGIGIGAEHYYGKLIDQSLPWEERIKNEQTVKRPLGSKEARELSKKDTEMFDEKIRCTYRKGDLTDRFASESDVIAQAKKTWKELYPHGEILLLGDDGTAQPVLPIDGTPAILEEALQIWEEFEVYWNAGGWEKESNNKPMKAISQRWYKAVQPQFLK